MISNEEQLNKAIAELELRTSNTPQDREQLNKIIFEILGYPRIQLAQKHHRANNMGENDLLSKQAETEADIRSGNFKNSQVCNCCGLSVNNEELNYCVSFDQLKIGMGVVLFFKNYKYTAIIFLTMFIIYGIYAIATNVAATDIAITTESALCFIPGNPSSELCDLASIGAGTKLLQPDNRKDRLSIIQSWIGVAFVIIWGIIIMVKTHMQRKLVIEMDIKRVSASDFTIMITQFPKIFLENAYEINLKEINRVFESYAREMNTLFSYEVVKYNVGKPLFTENEELKQRKQEMEERMKQHQKVFRNWIHYRKHNLDFPKNYQARIKDYEDYVKFYSSQYDIVSLRDAPLGEKNIVFLTFRSSKAVEQICMLNKPPSWKNFWNLCKQSNFPIKGVIIQRAPEPEEIKWLKIGFPKDKKYIRKALLWVLTLVLIGITLGISIGIAYIDENRINRYVSVGISLVVTVANVLIQMAIMFLSYLENQHISSHEQSKIAFKIGIGQLINSIGVPIIVTIIANADESVPDKTWLKAGGLVQDVFFIALFNLAVPFGRFLDPYQILLNLQRWWYSDPDRRLEMFGQKEFNQYFGNYEFDIGYEYAYLIKTALFTAFFACMQPIIVLFAPIGLVLYYLANKRNLLRHFQRPAFHYATINESVDLILLFCPIAFGFGHLLVNNFIEQEIQEYRNGTLLANWIMVVIGAVFLLLVPLNIFYCCVEKPQFPHWDYFQKKPIIPTDYDRMNPMTQNQAIGQFQSYLLQLQQNQRLPDEGRMIMLKMSNLRVTNRRNTKKRQLSESLRKSFNAPQYNYDLNKYNQYIQPEHEDERKKQNTGNNSIERTNSFLIDESLKRPSREQKQQFYPELDDYQRDPRNPY